MTNGTALLVGIPPRFAYRLSERGGSTNATAD